MPPRKSPAAQTGKPHLLIRLKLRFGLLYRCRCGALVRPRYRQGHEHMHDAIREWMAPPSAEDMAALNTPRPTRRTR